MKPPRFSYARAESLEEALGWLEQAGDDARIIAGGQSLVPLLNFRLARPSVLIDITQIGELNGIEHDGDHLRIGAVTLQRTAELAPWSPSIAPSWPRRSSLSATSRSAIVARSEEASPTLTRPASCPRCVRCSTPSSSREATVATGSLPRPTFSRGPTPPRLESDELLTEIRLPVKAGRDALVELARRQGDYALAGVAASAQAVGPRTSIALTAFGVGGAPQRLVEAESMLAGTRLDHASQDEAARLAGEEVSPFDDIHADARFRRELARTLTRRALRQVAP